MTDEPLVHRVLSLHRSFLLSAKCVKLHKRPAPPSASDGSFHKQSANNNNNNNNKKMAAPTQKPLRERIVHLLALKPYRKPELLLWLERERAGPRDKAELGATLEEVRRDVCLFVCLFGPFLRPGSKPCGHCFLVLN